jgi:hypothetical protein
VFWRFDPPKKMAYVGDWLCHHAWPRLSGHRTCPESSKARQFRACCLSERLARLTAARQGRRPSESLRRFPCRVPLTVCCCGVAQ